MHSNGTTNNGSPLQTILFTTDRTTLMQIYYSDTSYQELLNEQANRWSNESDYHIAFNYSLKLTNDSKWIHFHIKWLDSTRKNSFFTLLVPFFNLKLNRWNNFLFVVKSGLPKMVGKVQCTRNDTNHKVHNLRPSLFDIWSNPNSSDNNSCKHKCKQTVNKAEWTLLGLIGVRESRIVGHGGSTLFHQFWILGNGHLLAINLLDIQFDNVEHGEQQVINSNQKHKNYYKAKLSLGRRCWGQHKHNNL